MEQEDKVLLLRDLSARLPYGVKVQRYNYDDVETIETLYEIDCDGCMSTLECEALRPVSKPYLFPLSSMTEEQQKEANIFDDMDMDILSENLGRNHRNKTNIPTATYNYIDWLNKNHFDYRGLIEKGLAIDATGLNIY